MLVCGEPPFQETNDSETLTRILDCKYHMPPHVSPACQRYVPQVPHAAPCFSCMSKVCTTSTTCHPMFLLHVKGMSSTTCRPMFLLHVKGMYHKYHMPPHVSPACQRYVPQVPHAAPCFSCMSKVCTTSTTCRPMFLLHVKGMYHKYHMPPHVSPACQRYVKYHMPPHVSPACQRYVPQVPHAAPCFSCMSKVCTTSTTCHPMFLLHVKGMSSTTCRPMFLLHVKGMYHKYHMPPHVSPACQRYVPQVPHAAPCFSCMSKVCQVPHAAPCFSCMSKVCTTSTTWRPMFLLHVKGMYHKYHMPPHVSPACQRYVPQVPHAAPCFSCMSKVCTTSTTCRPMFLLHVKGMYHKYHMPPHVSPACQRYVPQVPHAAPCFSCMSKVCTTSTTCRPMFLLHVKGMYHKYHMPPHVSPACQRYVPQVPHAAPCFSCMSKVCTTSTTCRPMFLLHVKGMYHKYHMPPHVSPACQRYVKYHMPPHVSPACQRYGFLIALSHSMYDSLQRIDRVVNK